MNMALPPLMAMLVGTTAVTALPRLIAARHPGVQSLCRWTSLFSLLAGMALSTCGSTAAAGLLAGVLTQGIGWMVVRCWLPRESSVTFDETKLLHALAHLTAAVR